MHKPEDIRDIDAKLMKRTPKSHAGFRSLSMDNWPPPSQKIFIRPRRPCVHVTGDPAIAVSYHFIDIPINLGIGNGRRIFNDKAPPVGRTAGLHMALPDDRSDQKIGSGRLL